MRLGTLAFLTMLCSSLAAGTVQVQVRPVKPEVIKQRLEDYHGNDDEREVTLKHMFEHVGCGTEHLAELPVKHLKQPNLVCVLPGDSGSTILIGAHYDHASLGDGVIDNWSGASLLPSLYEALSDSHHHHTLIFAAFSGEEKGLLGSKFFVSQMPQDELQQIKAMICIDSIGLGPTEVWVSRSDKGLVSKLGAVAEALKLEVSGVNVDQVGMSDEEAFVHKKIPVIVLHSVTQKTLSILHSPRDNYKAVQFEDYYDTYRLLSTYVGYLDQTIEPEGAVPK